MPLSTQVKLLRVLEEKTLERVGDSRSIQVDVRIISATNRNLKKLVEQGDFRHDLYFRINVIPMVLPPLRNRRGDIPLLVESFFRKNQLKSGKPIQGISEDAMGALMQHPWPGNVRELKSAMEYAFVTCQGAVIQPHHLPPNIYESGQRSPDGTSRSLSREEIKRQELLEALAQAQGNQSEAARILGVSRVTVWNRMKRFGVYAERRLHLDGNG